MHLNDYPVFRNAIPSKLFEYAATGKPILAGVVGKTAEFVTDRVENAAVFTPCSVSAFILALEQLEFSLHSRTDFVERFRRSQIMKDMAYDVLQLADRS